MSADFYNDHCDVFFEFQSLFRRLVFKRRVTIDQSSPVFVYARKYIALVYKYLCAPDARISLSYHSLSNVREFFYCYDDSGRITVLRSHGWTKYLYLCSIGYYYHDAIRVVEADGSQFVDISRPKCSPLRSIRLSSLLLRRWLGCRFLHHAKI